MHIVEELIAERATNLVARRRLFRLVRPLLYRILAYDAAVFLADAMKDKTGHEAFELVTNHINPRTAIQGLQNLPANGPAIVISNHPTGLVDGMAVFQAIRDKRPEHVYLANADAALAMYHDQGLPVLKFHGFGRAANITLGLPIVRTSVDHGTALDLAGTGKADSGSLHTAIQVATQMAANRRKEITQ